MANDKEDTMKEPAPPKPKKNSDIHVVQAELPAELVDRMDAERIKDGKITRKAIIQFGIEYWLSLQSKKK